MSRKNLNRSKNVQKNDEGGVMDDFWDNVEEEILCAGNDENNAISDPKKKRGRPKKNQKKNSRETTDKFEEAPKGNKEELQRIKHELAAAVLPEEVIHNLNHRLHSNVNAVEAAWKRVSAKINKPGIYIVYWSNLI